MKTTLTVDIQYDGRRTDPEALAYAMDRLLETALSTPDILDEYGNPTIGEFFVMPKVPQMTMRDVLNEFVEDVKLAYGTGEGDEVDEEAVDWPDLCVTYTHALAALEAAAETTAEATATLRPKVVLNISGGVLQDVFGDPHAIDVISVDWDVEGCSPQDPHMVEIPDGEGTRLAAVSECGVLAMEHIVGTDAEAAVKAAGLCCRATGDEAAETTKRWVIYDFDMKELATTTAYGSYEEAVADANDLNNVLVLLLTIQRVNA